MSLEPHQPAELIDDRRTIVTALPLKRPAREHLADLLGARVVDIRDPIDAADLVLTPPCSPQLIGALTRKYPGARIVVAELADWEFEIDLPGPVKRILKAGADAYVLADSLEELANKIAAPTRQHTPEEERAMQALASAATVDDLIAAFLRESVEYATEARTQERQHVSGHAEGGR